MPGGGKNARETAELTNAIQKFFIEHSRLGIPVMFHEECLHGHAAIEATSFPQPIGLGTTFNPALVEQLYAMAAEEARVLGAHQALGLVVPAGAKASGILETLGYIVHGDRADLANSNVADVASSIINMLGTDTTIIVILLSPPLAKKFGKKAVAVTGFAFASLGSLAFYFLIFLR